MTGSARGGSASGDGLRPEPEAAELGAAELDAFAAVPDDVLAYLVAVHGRCLWEITDGDPPTWSGEGSPDRELAARLCAGCPVRRECLEFELRVGGADTVGVWGGLNENDRRALHAIWSVRGARRLPGPQQDLETSHDDIDHDDTDGGEQ